MGLNPILDSQWLAPFRVEQYQRFLAHKNARLQEPECPILADESARAPLHELQPTLRRYLQTHHSDEIDQNNIDFGCLDGSSPVECLKSMSLWVPDDICILQRASELGREPEDDYVLTAASVLSPSHWRPEQKFLKPLSEIHSLIPGFDSNLTPKVTRFFNHLKPGKPVVRFNWGVQPGNALEWRSESEPELETHPTLFYRSERQTLLRLPKTDAVVFFIRIDCCSLDELDSYYGVPNAKALLLEHIAGLPEVEREYKGFPRFGI
jgi:hypothetical protein